MARNAVIAHSIEDASVMPGERPMPSAWVWLTATVVIALVVEAAACGVELITPLEPSWIHGLRIAGGLYGIAAAANLMLCRARPDRALNRMVLWVVISLGGAMAFTAIGWRMAALMAFANSAAPWEDARFGVESAHRSDKSAAYHLTIDPLHTGRAIQVPITAQQYRAIRQQGGGDLCVTLPQRRAASGAIEVQVRRPYSWDPGPVEVGPCTDPAAGPDGATNPWR